MLFCATAAGVLGQYVGEGVQGLQELQELRVWLGSGAEARQAAGQLLRLVDTCLHSCKCVLLQEPERPML